MERYLRELLWSFIYLFTICIPPARVLFPETPFRCGELESLREGMASQEGIGEGQLGLVRGQFAIVNLSVLILCNKG